MNKNVSNQVRLQTMYDIFAHRSFQLSNLFHLFEVLDNMLKSVKILQL